MRLIALIAAAVVLSACDKPADEAPEGMTEAAEASGVAADPAPPAPGNSPSPPAPAR